MLSESVIVVAKLLRAFDALGIRYPVGGSFASSVYGIPRATQDVDLVAAVQLSQVGAVARCPRSAASRQERAARGDMTAGGSPYKPSQRTVIGGACR